MRHALSRYNRETVAPVKTARALPCLSAGRWLSRSSQSAEARWNQARMSQVIALVDDDRNILTSVSIALQPEGFVTRVYSDGATALKALDRQPARPWRVRHQDAAAWTGWSCSAGCARSSAMPVIFLTSKDDELDEALGLAMGADDYIAKPFSQRLLIARIRAILRRQELARGEAASSSDGSRAAAARARPAGHGPGAAQGAVGRQGRHA